MHNFARDLGGQRLGILGDIAAVGHHDRDRLDLNPVVVKIAGRIMLKRVMGKASFAQLQDSSGTIQLYLTDKDKCNKLADEIQAMV